MSRFLTHTHTHRPTAVGHFKLLMSLLSLESFLKRLSRAASRALALPISVFTGNLGGPHEFLTRGGHPF